MHIKFKSSFLDCAGLRVNWLQNGFGGDKQFPICAMDVIQRHIKLPISNINTFSYNTTYMCKLG